jgi:hypothetical protein
MNATSLLRRLSHLPRRIVRESLMVFNVVQFFLINRFGNERLIESGGPVVSLTTHGRRSESVYYAIESIARGSVRPSRLILWIDDEGLFNNLPATIRRLQKRLLEVRFSKNYGPHTKYYPYLESQEVFDTPLVTADDDILYPTYWLKQLVEAIQQCPDNVNCFWAHEVTMSEGGIAKSQDWKQCDSTRPRYRNVAAGVTGVIYPPAFLRYLKEAGAAFEATCPKADDLWLHVQALRSGYKARQILPRLPYFSFRVIPGTQSTALCFYNVDEAGNDRQIRTTYNDADIQLLRADQA